MTEIRCVGCGSLIGKNIDIRGGWDYTCPCGAHLFTFDGKLALPRSLFAYIAYQKYGKSSPLGIVNTIPHLEYFIGYSDYMDNNKRDAIEALKLVGSISSDDCQDIECKNERNRRIEMMQGALKEDYYLNMPDDRLAAHFHLSIKKVREIKGMNIKIISDV